MLLAPHHPTTTIRAFSHRKLGVHTRRVLLHARPCRYAEAARAWCVLRASDVAELLALRRAEPALRHDQWFHPSSVTPGECTLAWFTPGGAEMHVHDWHDGGQHAFACRIDAGWGILCNGIRYIVA